MKNWKLSAEIFRIAPGCMSEDVRIAEMKLIFFAAARAQFHKQFASKV